MSDMKCRTCDAVFDSEDGLKPCSSPSPGRPYVETGVGNHIFDVPVPVEEPRECWCPCGCGCLDEEYAPCGLLKPSGLCSSCERGIHEIIPEGGEVTRQAILNQFKSIVADYERIMSDE